jgi:hypothetical protein
MPNDTHTDPTPREITVVVHAPRTPEEKKFTWKVMMLVGAAADEAARAFGYEGGTPSLQNKDGRVLDRQKSLFEEHVHNHDALELVDTGGGV